MFGKTPLLCCAALLSLAACASEPRLFDPGRPEKADVEVLKRAELAYRKGEPYDDDLAAIQQDPVAAFWFTRMLVRDLVTTREAKASSGESRKERMDVALTRFQRRQRGAGPDQDLVQSFLGARDPIEARAIEGIHALGRAAVPCLVEDLARNGQTFLRQLGVELLAGLGEVARPEVRKLATSGNAKERRTAALILGEQPPGTGIDPELAELARDSDYAVRATALRGLAGGDREVSAFLRQRLRDDDDPFVRRAAAAALAVSDEVATVEALIEYLERSKDERDARGVDTAQQSLQSIAGTRGDRSSQAWRTWARTYQPKKDV